MGLSKRLGWLLYQLVMAVGLLLAAPVLIARRGHHYLATLRGRLGWDLGARVSRADEPSEHEQAAKVSVWIHAVSVGEVVVAATLAARLPRHLRLVVTTVTPTGQERARALFSETSRRPATVAYLPFDLGFAVARFYRRFSPAVLILVEGDYWPLVLEAARRRGVPVVTVNARVGEVSGRRLRRFPRLARRLFFDPVRCFAVQTDDDRQRLIAAGAAPERVHVAGNLKFDATAPAAKPDLEAAVRQVAGDRPILLAGSTMLGEDEHVIDAFKRLGAGQRALLVIAPRHPERFAAVARLVRDQGLVVQRRSEPTESEDLVDEDLVDVLVLDTLGELASLYRIADIAFIGGTLVSTGGHNPLEPASFAVPIVVGPSMHNFRDMAQRFDDSEAWRRVDNAQELAQLWDTWLTDPEQAQAVGHRAAKLLAENRGAVDRTLGLIEPFLAAHQAPKAKTDKTETEETSTQEIHR